MGVGFKWTGLLVVLFFSLALVPQASAAKKVRCKNAGIVHPGSQFPVELPGSLEAPVLSSFGVLRRAALPGDALPPVNAAATEVEGQLTGYYASEIRQVAKLPNGRRFFLVPGLPRTLSLRNPSCLPASLRKLVESQQKKAAEPRYCIVEAPSREAFAMGECEPFADAAKSSSLFHLFHSGEPVALLVPDGVGDVRITGPGKAAVTVPVSENSYVYTPPSGIVKLTAVLLHKLFRAEQLPAHPTKAQRRRAFQRFERTLEEVANRTEPSKVEWLGAAGAVVRTTRRPSNAGLGIFGGILGGISG
ncbi:MAG: hypothetical protein QOK19_141 [Solirubrobacteraceae bacterium]|jgi:hypothetical protein|nr:hypothetical protein [Solirubrobacteraceae bacterium]